MSTKYLPQQFEEKWTEIWEEKEVYKTGKVGNGLDRSLLDRSLQKPPSKIYCLPMFPYPSGAGLHVGHVRIYTGCDVLARYFRMKGYPVLHPMGWDAFGLPAENAAIKAQKNPMDMVPANIANFKQQMKRLGLSYSWSREFATSDPDYYQWTQWLFIQFFKMGLLYKKNSPINFCPVCKTGLAEEEVLADGTHERCGNQITKKALPQWLFRITAYADRLLKDLEGLDWPAGILEMQKNWIGRKEGINIDYQIVGSEKKITVFTTTPVNFGASFLVVAPEHPLLREKMIPQEFKKAVDDYVSVSLSKSPQARLEEVNDKTGVFTGLYVLNHVTGEKIPVWVSDFVLMDFGAGAIQGCPGHDKRDFQFAQKFKLPIRRVVVGADGDRSEIVSESQVVERGMRGTMINSAFLDGMDFDQAMIKTMDYFEKKDWGKRVTTYHLRDWIFSRQHYWGEPIPMIFCSNCAEKKISYWDGNKNEKSKILNLKSLSGWFPVPEEQLPVKLPYVKNYVPTETGESPLAKIESFVKTTCPHCGGKARRETDTMPNWAGSCWYFLRFAQEDGKSKNLKSKLLNLNSPWLPVDWYLGGAEHAVLHLLYARFWIKALYDLGLVDFQEPFLRLRNVGIVLALDHRKMSKSFGNVVNPDEVVAGFGADALRLYEMFMAPFDSEISWSEQALQGAYRFLKRIWQIYTNSDSLTNNHNDEDKKLVVELQRVIDKVSSDIPNVKFNTAIAAMMEFLNQWENRARDKPRVVPTKNENGKLSKENAKKFLQILAPFAPFMTEEIWREVVKEKTSIHLSSWPEANPSLLKEEEIVIPVQVNGKLRAVITLSVNEIENQNTVVKKALENEKIKHYVERKNYKVIYVKGKVLNFVLK